jgi:hypothetical protein
VAAKPPSGPQSLDRAAESLHGRNLIDVELPSTMRECEPTQACALVAR